MGAETGIQNGIPNVLVATGSNIPQPLVYRGSTKKENREFMDRYLTYVRKIMAPNQGTNSKVMIMPLRTCIDNKTMARICMYEMFVDVGTVTDAQWVAYFRKATEPDDSDYEKLEGAMKGARCKRGYSQKEYVAQMRQSPTRRFPVSISRRERVPRTQKDWGSTSNWCSGNNKYY